VCGELVWHILYNSSQVAVSRGVEVENDTRRPGSETAAEKVCGINLTDIMVDGRMPSILSATRKTSVSTKLDVRPFTPLKSLSGQIDGH
jgi:hypothetical protein